MKKDIKAIVLDADGVIINKPDMFSVQYQKEFGISNEVMLPFFKGRFQDCLTGKADLKEELKPFLKKWAWPGTVEELLNYWFKSEHYIDERIVAEIEDLKRMGIKCYLGTDQEKYRTEYIRKNMGLEKIFDKIYSSAEMGCKKPDKEFFKSMAEDLRQGENIQPEKIMFWDDDEKNVAAGKDFGIQGYLYKNFNEFYKIVSQIK